MSSVTAGVLFTLVNGAAPGACSNVMVQETAEIQNGFSGLSVSRGVDASSEIDASLVQPSPTGNARGWRSVLVRVRLNSSGSVAVDAATAAQGSSRGEQTALWLGRKPAILQSRHVRLQV